jgi:putative hydrolase of the HAD superfamily/pyrimidine and pyridine-specific 5'-nucleotidase
MSLSAMLYFIFKVVFFDCDDCLYFDNWKTANELTAKIEQWCVEKVGLPEGKAYELYKQHGTALRGLLAEGYIENSPEHIDTFLREVHDIPIHDLIKPDKKLREILLKMDPTIPKFIFTASVSHHARRCLRALGIEDIFEDEIIDVKKCDLETKHSNHSFRAAMKVAQVDEPEACVFLDDSVKNIQAAREIGWRSVLVGKVGRDCGKPIFSDHAELEIDRIHEIRQCLPELFIPQYEA